jgi:hypothetical protein
METDINIWADNFMELHPEYAADIDGLQAILNKDYAAEVEEAQKKL